MVVYLSFVHSHYVYYLYIYKQKNKLNIIHEEGQKDEPLDNFHQDYPKIVHTILGIVIKLIHLFFYRRPIKIKKKKVIQHFVIIIKIK